MINTHSDVEEAFGLDVQELDTLSRTLVAVPNINAYYKKKPHGNINFVSICPLLLLLPFDCENQVWPKPIITYITLNIYLSHRRNKPVNPKPNEISM